MGDNMLTRWRKNELEIRAQKIAKLETQLAKTRQALSEREAAYEELEDGWHKFRIVAEEVNNKLRNQEKDLEEVIETLRWEIDDIKINWDKSEKEHEAQATIYVEKIAELENVLGGLQWIKPYYRENARFRYCPSCGNLEEEGHSEHCWAASALKDIGDA